MDDYLRMSLAKLCRFCGYHLTDQAMFLYSSVSMRLAKFTSLIPSSIDVSEDSEEIHPRSLCHKCKSDLNNVLKRDSTVPNKFIEWPIHTSKCMTCLLNTNGERVKPVGRPEKKKATGKPSIVSAWIREFSKELLNMYPPSLISTELPSPSLFDEKMNPNLNLCICLLCFKLLDQPVLNIHCQHVVCSKCLLMRIEGLKLCEIKCPLCPTVKEWEFLKDIPLGKNSFVPAIITMQIIESLKVTCEKGRGQVFGINELCQKEEHEDYCFYKERKMHPIEDVFELGPSEDIPQVYEDVALHIIKTKMAKSCLPNKGAALNDRRKAICCHKHATSVIKD
ncbi:uncharacterized protein [Clytia hemisphaerica]|uniref:uncharacterized protein n=1 Tax=Clytia hemisphaerica TaxID=252671 RepID=UPI0034D50DD6